MKISRNELAVFLPLNPRRSAVGAYWRSVALGTPAVCAGIRFALPGERLKGTVPFAGCWRVYRPASTGRSATEGYGPPPTGGSVEIASFAGIRTYRDVLIARARLLGFDGGLHAEPDGDGLWRVHRDSDGSAVAVVLGPWDEGGTEKWRMALGVEVAGQWKEP